MSYSADFAANNLEVLCYDDQAYREKELTINESYTLYASTFTATLVVLSTKVDPRVVRVKNICNGRILIT